jgi:hypothetical protein
LITPNNFQSVDWSFTETCNQTWKDQALATSNEQLPETNINEYMSKFLQISNTIIEN